MARKPIHDDPVENEVAYMLDRLHIKYLRDVEVDEGSTSIDFYVPSIDLYIEVKRFHAPRVLKQLGQRENIILIQGLPAAKAFVQLMQIGSNRLDNNFYR